MTDADRHVVDEMNTPGGRLLLVAYRRQGTVWIGVDRDDGGSIGAIGLRTGSIETQVAGSSSITNDLAIGWGVVAPSIVRAEFRNDEGEAFPVTIGPLPTDL